MTSPGVMQIGSLFRQVAPAGYWRRLYAQSGFSKRGIFSLPLVVWMMITQRLQPAGTLATAVQQLRAGTYGKLLNRCKRVREGKISAATGGYCQARRKLSKLVVSQIVDDLFERLQAVLREGWPSLERPLFLLDGSASLLEHNSELTAAYPPAKNQHGRSHWPVLRMVVAHDLDSGLAVRPCWGAACGPGAISEQRLVEEVIQRLPAGAVVLGDRNFGVFSVAWAAHQRQHPVLFRLTHARAQKLLGRAPQAGLDQAVVWKPSHHDRRAHPELSTSLQVAGRLIVCECQGAREPLLALFTTLPQPGKEILAMYSLRWNIETDLRSLKRTVRLHQVHARSLAMVEKEILLAVLAYNLVRTVMCLAARQAGISPRQLSFTNVYHLVEAHLPSLLGARSAPAWQREMDKLVAYAAAYKLPQRTKPRSYPRRVWGEGFRFPKRKAEEKN
jgi:hypothetical protein